MPTKLIVGLIIVFCYDFALAASCGKDEVLIVKSKMPLYSAGTCLKISQIEPPKILKQGECIVVKLNNGQKRTICDPENDLISFIKKIIKLIELSASSHCDIQQTSTCSLTDLSSADGIKRTDEVLINPGILALTHDAKVTANEYPAHTDKEHTKPLEYQVDMALVIDITGSMQQEMNETKHQLKKFVADIDLNQFPLTALVVFRDELILKAVTPDIDVIVNAIDQMKASGGGTCPEAFVEALDVAISHVKEGGTIFFVTNASPYEDADVVGISERLKAKKIIFSTIITGDCSNRESWNLIKD